MPLFTCKKQWRELAIEIGLKSSGNPPSPKLLIEATQTLLKSQTIVFILRNPARVGEECIKQFLDSFWAPLFTINEPHASFSPHYCLLFLIDNDDCIDKWITVDARPFDLSWKPSNPIDLSKLTRFQAEDLASWIDHEAEAWSITPSIQDILSNNNGIPERVLDRICSIFAQDWYEREKTWLRY